MIGTDKQKKYAERLLKTIIVPNGEREKKAHEYAIRKIIESDYKASRLIDDIKKNPDQINVLGSQFQLHYKMYLERRNPLIEFDEVKNKHDLLSCILYDDGFIFADDTIGVICSKLKTIEEVEQKIIDIKNKKANYEKTYYNRSTSVNNDMFGYNNGTFGT